MSMPMKKVRRIRMLKTETAPGQDQRPVAVDQPQRADQQVRRDQPGAEEHRDQEDEQDRAVPERARPRQPVGAQDRHGDRQDRADDR